VAGFAIALALLVVGIVCVPVRLWASRMGASLRSGRTVEDLDADTPPDATGLSGLRQRGRALLVLAERLRGLAPEYRRTLPYVSLFFADPRQGLHVRRDRWIIGVRRDFEAAIERFATSARAWWSAAEALDGRDRAALEAAGGVPAPLHALLDEMGGLPRSVVEARRWRFCEETELDELMQVVGALVEDLRRLELDLSATGAKPYR
jgi:hypothetical protein